MDPLPDDLDTFVRAELTVGERPLWVGQPLPRRFMRSSIPLVLFGIPWTAFALFWVATASGMLFGGERPNQAGVGWFFSCFPLFGVPFVLIGFAMLGSPVWAYRRARRTCYAVTDQRAVVWSAGWLGSVEVRSFRPADLGSMTRREYADGSGDLIFEEFVTTSRDGDGGVHSHRLERGFIGIDNVREVEEVVRRALLAGK
jgi:hypothetical protein